MENKNNNIENNIFNELDDYDIKTTSNSILNAYYQKKETAKKKTKNKGLYITAGTNSLFSLCFNYTYWLSLSFQTEMDNNSCYKHTNTSSS